MKKDIINIGDYIKKNMEEKGFIVISMAITREAIVLHFIDEDKKDFTITIADQENTMKLTQSTIDYYKYIEEVGIPRIRAQERIAPRNHHRKGIPFTNTGTVSDLVKKSWKKKKEKMQNFKKMLNSENYKE